MHPIEKAIGDYQKSLCKEIDIIGLRKRNPIAHKWKVTYQILCLRETVAWRFVDILGQSWMLHAAKRAIGARILLRASIETLAIIIYLDTLIEGVILGKLNFNTFSEKVLNLLLQCRDEMTDQKATNIVTILEKCEKKYPGTIKLYAWLSESAHPNFEGMRICYSTTDQEEMITRFSNQTEILYSHMHENGCLLAMCMFEREYEDSRLAFEDLEIWLVQNEKLLNDARQ
ncbi:hypothetical protein JAB1_14820 [Janthinobacterium sp. MP5059B]|uniref:hypothetical protein n=1 Tax=Janthinobacterium sp. MP5059B TaxID=1766683 RepID=UPI000892CBA5|nr:hypothetical protein [Janthinobacterium sp. MP5059B]OEZ50367.1 hypothetical protein JAB1_14820 [Janthinobacterium sp. MP5059B]